MATAPSLSREALAERDASDPLATFRQRFDLPRGLIYLDGNSLGPLPRDVPARLETALREEWGRSLIGGWRQHGWMELPLRIGDAIAPLIGAKPGEVLVADSTSVCLFKVLSAALSLRPGRNVILTDSGNFPTDLYVAGGLARLRGLPCELRVVPREKLRDALTDDVAVLLLSQVDYLTGELLDLRTLTAAAHTAGVLTVWDLSHSAGALPIHLSGAQADFAVGCGYKFLNGGPGAPAWLYVAERHQRLARQPLSGWLGHADPFAFESAYRPAPGIARFLTGTPPVLSLLALQVGLTVFEDVELAQVRAKSVALGEAFAGLVAEQAPALLLSSPTDPTRRGSQICFRYPDAEGVIEAMATQGVIGDFRPPDVLRFGLAPLYLRYVDVWEAVATLREVLSVKYN